MFGWLRKLGAEIKRIVTYVCEHPTHLQRLSIIGAGVAVYPSLAAMVAILVWFGTHPAVNAALVIPIFGNIAYGLILLFGLVVIAVLGIVRGVKAMLPNGASIAVDLLDAKDKEHGHDENC